MYPHKEFITVNNNVFPGPNPQPIPTPVPELPFPPVGANDKRQWKSGLSVPENLTATQENSSAH